jgi:hypothetical protein
MLSTTLQRGVGPASVNEKPHGLATMPAQTWWNWIQPARWKL